MASKLIAPGMRTLSTPEKVSAFRARDVRVMLQGTNTDPKVAKILETLAESIHAQDKQVMSMAQAINQMTDLMVGMVGVADNMKKFIEQNSIREEEGPVV
jgi:hypothetical protein